MDRFKFNKISKSNNNLAWSIFCANYLYHLGVKYACISPGARSSALTYSFSEKSKIKCFSHVDERSSAFFALGLAKSDMSPVVLICTSGTAPANYFPAVIEASLSCTPILIISADRPSYLVNTGSNQTINQHKLFGNFVRHFVDVGLPNKDISNLKNNISVAMSSAKGSLFKLAPGPVHLNFPFEEPLLSSEIIDTVLPEFTFKTNKKNKKIKNFSILKNINKPIIIVGPLNQNSGQNSIVELSNKLNAPILADPLSQLRNGYSSDNIIVNYDLFLKHINLNPDCIIRFGKKPTSKILGQLINDWNHKLIYVDPWNQNNDNSINFVQSDINDYCHFQIDNLKINISNKWIQYIQELQNMVELEVARQQDEFHEGNIVRTCIQTLKEHSKLIIGNSMPIRDVDMFGYKSDKIIHIFGNRGASGIDGVISTALGISETDKINPSLLIIGDLSFYHDMNGLLAAKNKMNITIVVINNSGGGIFSFLPLSQIRKDLYDSFWNTDTNIEIKMVANIYSCKFYRSTNLSSLRKNIEKCMQHKGVKIIEVVTNIRNNLDSHNKLYSKIKKIVKTI